MAKPKSLRMYHGKGNQNNRLKRDAKNLLRIEREGKPAGYQGVRWNAA